MDQVISHLDPMCIVCGRGQKLYSTHGNKVFRHIVSSYRKEYDAGTKAERSGIVKKVYNKLIGDGMKFVKRSEGKDDCWVVLGAPEGKNKVAHRFRDQIKPASTIKQHPAIQIKRDEMASRNPFPSIANGDSEQHKSSPTWVSFSGVGYHLTPQNGLLPYDNSTPSPSHIDEYLSSRLRKEISALLRSP